MNNREKIKQVFSSLTSIRDRVRDRFDKTSILYGSHEDFTPKKTASLNTCFTKQSILAKATSLRLEPSEISALSNKDKTAYKSGMRAISNIIKKVAFNPDTSYDAGDYSDDDEDYSVNRDDSEYVEEGNYSDDEEGSLYKDEFIEQDNDEASDWLNNFENNQVDDEITQAIDHSSKVEPEPFQLVGDKYQEEYQEVRTDQEAIESLLSLEFEEKQHVKELVDEKTESALAKESEVLDEEQVKKPKKKTKKVLKEEDKNLKLLFDEVKKEEEPEPKNKEDEDESAVRVLKYDPQELLAQKFTRDLMFYPTEAKVSKPLTLKELKSFADSSIDKKVYVTGHISLDGKTAIKALKPKGMKAFLDNEYKKLVTDEVYRFEREEEFSKVNKTKSVTRAKKEDAAKKLNVVKTKAPNNIKVRDEVIKQDSVSLVESIGSDNDLMKAKSTNRKMSEPIFLLAKKEYQAAKSQNNEQRAAKILVTYKSLEEELERDNKHNRTLDQSFGAAAFTTMVKVNHKLSLDQELMIDLKAEAMQNLTMGTAKKSKMLESGMALGFTAGSFFTYYDPKKVMRSKTPVIASLMATFKSSILNAINSKKYHWRVTEAQGYTNQSDHGNDRTTEEALDILLDKNGSPFIENQEYIASLEDVIDDRMDKKTISEDEISSLHFEALRDRILSNPDMVLSDEHQKEYDKLEREYIKREKKNKEREIHVGFDEHLYIRTYIGMTDKALQAGINKFNKNRGRPSQYKDKGVGIHSSFYITNRVQVNYEKLTVGGNNLVPWRQVNAYLRLFDVPMKGTGSENSVKKVRTVINTTKSQYRSNENYGIESVLEIKDFPIDQYRKDKTSIEGIDKKVKAVVSKNNDRINNIKSLVNEFDILGKTKANKIKKRERTLKNINKMKNSKGADVKFTPKQLEDLLFLMSPRHNKNSPQYTESFSKKSQEEYVKEAHKMLDEAFGEGNHDPKKAKLGDWVYAIHEIDEINIRMEANTEEREFLVDLMEKEISSGKTASSMKNKIASMKNKISSLDYKTIEDVSEGTDRISKTLTALLVDKVSRESSTGRYKEALRIEKFEGSKIESTLNDMVEDEKGLDTEDMDINSMLSSIISETEETPSDFIFDSEDGTESDSVLFAIMGDLKN